jgi:nucleotide-binding universal stress UspA family protein
MAMAGNTSMREILLHGGGDEGFDESVAVARQLAESFAARLHVVFTVEDPLSAGWTAEVSAERLPELHQAMEDEARERLGRLIPPEDQERLGVEIVLRTGPAADELVRYTRDNAIDLAIVQSRAAGGAGADIARSLLDHGECAVLVLR